MDFGIQGKWALVCAASKGLGKGCAKALVGEGVNVVITARNREVLEATADELRALGRPHGAEVRTVAGDITTEPWLPVVAEANFRLTSICFAPAGTSI